MSSASFKQEKVAKKSTVTLKIGPVHNIIVLVSGTTDPINATSKDPSHSYPTPKKKADENDPEWYWKYKYGKKESTFFKDVKALADDLKKYNVAVFSAHGWSGDNAVKNREVTGHYLVNRLCGSSGEKPYYEKYLKEEVHFHLIGHSHGGNVINEMTKRMIACKEWPAKWSVKTIVYLSTPFFQKLHQVEPKAFHPGCEIINVFNDYDLTQRVVANFSLHELTDVKKVTDASMVGITDPLHHITGWKPDPKKEEDKGKPEIKPMNVQKLKDGILSVRLRDFDDRSWSVDLTWAMDPKQGAAMYKECIALFKNIDAIFDGAKGLITKLNGTLHFNVLKSLEGKVETEHQVIDDDLRDRFHGAIDKIKKGLAPTIKAFEARLKSGRFPVYGLRDDLHLDRFLRPIVEFLAVNAPGDNGRLSSQPAPKDSLLDLLHDLLKQQVDKFDDTTTTPSWQLRNTPFMSRVVHIDITEKDDYHNQRDDEFDRFIRYLANVEHRYFTKGESKGDLLDLLFTLVAQLEATSGITSTLFWSEVGMVAFADLDLAWLRACDAEFYFILAELFLSLNNYRRIFADRDFGGIVVTTDVPEKGDEKTGEGATFKRGDLQYLMRVSHSVSREALDPRVKELLVAQIKA